MQVCLLVRNLTVLNTPVQCRLTSQPTEQLLGHQSSSPSQGVELGGLQCNAAAQWADDF